MTGSGKTTLGKEIARKYNYHFVDMDEEIVANEGKSIEQIFDLSGELHFRQLETELLRSIINKDGNWIVSTGGGTPCFNQNMSIINENGISIWIDPSAQALTNRLWHSDNKENRPMIKNKTKHELAEFINIKLLERSQFYSQAKHQLHSDDIKLEEIVDLLVIEGFNID